MSEPKQEGAERGPLGKQIDELASWILKNTDGPTVEDNGAVGCAIRLMGEYKAERDALRDRRDQLLTGIQMGIYGMETLGESANREHFKAQKLEAERDKLRAELVTARETAVEDCAALLETPRCRNWDAKESAWQLRDNLKRGLLGKHRKEKADERVPQDNNDGSVHETIRASTESRGRAHRDGAR